MLASPATGNPDGVRGWVIAVELGLVAGLGWAFTIGWRRWGPSRLKGMATRDQAEQVLGVTRLRKVARIVRPDLHRSRHARGAER